MALTTRKLNGPMIVALIASYDLFRREFTKDFTTYPHVDITSTTSNDWQNPIATPRLCTAPLATDLATAIVRGNDAKLILNVHLVDATAHKATDTAIATADATDQATLNTLLNAIKTKLNAHGGSTTYHYTADGTNTVTSPDATDLASSVTLVNELYTDINAHIQFALTSPSIALVAP